MEIYYLFQRYFRRCLSTLYLCVFVIKIFVTGYNMDLTAPVIRQGGNDTFFGYSVAIHNESGEDMMIVGAPRADIKETNITTGGAVYRCPLLPYNYDLGGCQRISLEKKNDLDKSHQWLGAVVKSSGGTSSKVLSCSPLLKEAASDGDYLEPIGGCFISTKNFTKNRLQLPCLSRANVQLGYMKETHCQGGFSADIQQDGNFVLGGPGRKNGTGILYVKRKKTWSDTKDKFILENNSYLGYSVAQGTRGLDVVTGAPRAGTLMGKVFIFQYDGNTAQKRQLTGQQFGSYFGHSVAVVDLNNDGLDDLIVGAPNYMNSETKQVNVGQVYVYYQRQQRTLHEDSKSVITGQVTNGRFGFTIAPLGDVNDDGFNDFAVSAPYEGDGAVYIFNGRRETIHTTASQVLRPSDFETSVAMKRFGFSLSGNRDADKNAFPDLLIGAYESDTVILVRTKPIIHPEISISFSEDSVNLSRRNTSASTNSFSFEICLSYRTRGFIDQYFFRLFLSLDDDKSTPRAFLGTQNGQSKTELTVNVSKQEIHCRNWTAVMRDLSEIPDKRSPIPVRVSVELIESEGGLPAGQVPPYLETPSQHWEKQIPIIQRCINIEACAPDLILEVESDTEFMYMGDTDEVSINVTVFNRADEAFGARLYVDIPESFELSSYKAIHTESSITCELLAPSETVAVCNIGNPLPSSKTTKLKLSFDVHDVPGHTERLFINLTCNSTTREEADTLTNNNQTVVISLVPKVEVEMGGFSNIKSLIYKETENGEGSYSHEKDVGAEIIHSYWVKNKGPGVIEDAILHVSWPMRTESNDSLLYLTEFKISGGQECYVAPDNLNPDSLELNYYSYDTHFSKLEDVSTSEYWKSNNRTRTRRDTSLRAAESEPMFSSSEFSQNGNEFNADCSKGYLGCVNITCNVTNFPRNADTVLLTIRSRLYTETVQNVESRPWNIVSSARFKINRLPYVVQPAELSIESQTLSLRVRPTTRHLINPPLWAIILSVTLGNLLMVLIIICLWKIGFFKRKRMRRGMTELTGEEEIGENGKGMEIIHVSHDNHVNSVD